MGVGVYVGSLGTVQHGIKWGAKKHAERRESREAQQAKNRRERAALYHEFPGEIRGESDLKKWHSTLNALSRGSN